jgi:hypothetical protein
MNTPISEASQHSAFTYLASDEEIFDIFRLLQNPEISTSLERNGMVKIQTITKSTEHTLDTSYFKVSPPLPALNILLTLFFVEH